MAICTLRRQLESSGTSPCPCRYVGTLAASDLPVEAVIAAPARRR